MKKDILEGLKQKKANDILKVLYGHDVDINKQKLRYENLYKEHIKSFGNKGKTHFFSSPGRIEICGNHTDHNRGKVLCASINVDTLACVHKTDNNYITVNSIGFPPIKVALSDLKVDVKEYGQSIAFVKGILKYFEINGYKVGGFDATTTTDIFKGAGVSSSAAFCVLITTILNYFYNNNKISDMEKAKAAQFAESKYFGKPCGLMDQSAIALGGVSYIDFNDLVNPKVEKINWEFENIVVVLINTGGTHEKLTDDYTAIKDDMLSVSQYFKKYFLRDVDEKEFFERMFDLQNKVTGRAVLRAIHYFNENKRVINCKNAILNKKEKNFFDVVNESGESSDRLLQNTRTSNNLAQRIPLGVAVSLNGPVKANATRVHGGGFEGTVLAFIEKKYLKQYIEYMEKVFKPSNVHYVAIRNVGACAVEI